MLNKIWKQVLGRSFSKSTEWKNTEKTKSEFPVAAKGGEFDASIPPTLQGVPKQWEKRILVMSGKYKSLDEVPDRVSFDVMDKAKSKMRVKAANIMIVTTLVLCACTVFVAKQNVKNKNSVIDRVKRNYNELKQEGQSKTN